MVIKTIAVIGSGVMGGGIAQASAQYGYDVILEDLQKEYVAAGLKKIRKRLEKRVKEGKLEREELENTLSRIKTASSLEECCDADLVIEAAVEKEDVKKAIFQELDSFCGDKTIFATNTSSIPVTRLAKATKRPDRFVGMHFMNPAYIMKLVEVIKGPDTSEETAELVKAVCERMGKIAVAVNDSPGFVISRVLATMINDAIFCLQEGVASKEGIDTIMKTGANHPMGPFELADLMGLDVCLEILRALYADLGEKYRPCALLADMVSSGKLGRKSGEGFYEYR
jgi:3-hydroxybutyryl-CoA dehydrogenase